VEVQPTGFWGAVALPDTSLGRIAEREPNDAAAQAYRLPPAFARSQLEVVGNLGVTADHYGAADALDVLRFVVLAASDVALTVEHRSVDPVGGGLNDVTLEVRDAGGVLLDEASGPSPLTVAFQVAAAAPVFVSLRAVNGHTPWVATFVTSDSPVPAKPASPRLLTLPAATSSSAAVAGAPLSECSENHVLVRLKPGVDATGWARRHGHALGAPTGSGTWRVLLGEAPGAAPAAPGSEKQGARVARARKAATGFVADPDVLWSEPDWRVLPLSTSNDPELARQWNLHAVDAAEAWDITRGVASMVVGVIDSGVLAHPALAGQTVAGYDFISDPALAADGDARDADPTDQGDHGAGNGLSLWHGTHVAALVAGKADDGEGVAGLAPGCRVMPLRALGRGGGLVSDVSDAILFASGQLTTLDGRRLNAALRVVNLSLGTTAYSAELEAACATAYGEGVLLVAASGNDGGPVLYPALFPTVLAVGAVDGMLNGTSYSSRGPQVGLCAPGGFSLQDAQGDGWPDAVPSAARDETLYPAPYDVVYQSGTSQAAPHVSATAALLLSLDPSLSRGQLRSRLEQSALDRGQPGADDLHGWGLVQPQRALKRLLEHLGTPLTTPPRLHLPVAGLRFLGLEASKRIPLVNSGTGTLTLLGAQVVTDDGGDWLGTAFVENFPGADVSASHLDVLVDRTRTPPGATWVSGTVRLYSPTQSLGLVRVIAAVSVWPRAGSVLRVVAIDEDSGGVPSLAVAHPQHDYRYVLSNLAEATYQVRAGEDLDADGFACEPYDLCGWVGGLTQDLATPLPFVPGTVVTGIDVTLGLTTPP
jgi:serine protease